MASDMAAPSRHRLFAPGVLPAFVILGMKQIKEEERLCLSKAHVVS
jgi:hypothetical protein